jgi:acetylornithine/N-succinyldiaminopimelate aminotransferase
MTAAATDPLLSLSHYYLPVYKPRQVVLERGQGARVWDNQGREFIDLAAGIAVCGLGHNDPDLTVALIEQAGKLWHTSNVFYSEPPLRLAEELVTASRFAERVFLCNSGAEANEVAIKLVRKWASSLGRPAHQRVIVTFRGSFHGRTLAAVTATAQPKYQEGYEPLPGGFRYVDFNDEVQLETAMAAGDVAAVMLEPIQGEGGVIPATPEFMRELRALTKQHNLLLIVDEVQSGCGRAGTLFAYELSDIEPDIMTLGKGIGSGVPLAALLSKADVAVFEAGDQGGTYNGNPLMTAAGYSVISQLVAPGFLEGVRARGEYLKRKLLELSEERGFEGERGEGLLRALLLGKDIGPQIVEKARDMQPDGLLLNAARPNLLRFMPALTVTTDEIDQMMAMLRSILDTL